jgi:hypothetical protein
MATQITSVEREKIEHFVELLERTQDWEIPVEWATTITARGPEEIVNLRLPSFGEESGDETSKWRTIDGTASYVAAFLAGYVMATVERWTVRASISQAESVWYDRIDDRFVLAVEPDQPGAIWLADVEFDTPIAEVYRAAERASRAAEQDALDDEREEVATTLVGRLTHRERGIVLGYKLESETAKDHRCKYGHADCATTPRGRCSNETFANALSVIEGTGLTDPGTYEEVEWLDFVASVLEMCEEMEREEEMEDARRDRLNVRVGDRVRSYDFVVDSRVDENSYVEGYVEEIRCFDDLRLGGCDRYRIRTVRRVFGGNEIDIPEHEREVFPPKNGTPILGGGETSYVAKMRQVRSTDGDDSVYEWEPIS